MSLNGIDISAWQKGIDLITVPADFVIIKATEGTDYVSSDCDRAYQQAKLAGKRLGVYHFATGNTSGTREADYFIDNIQGYIGEAVLVLDWEGEALATGVGYAKEFLDRVYERTGIKPMIYMSGSVEHEYDWSSVVAGDYGLWVAYYSIEECYNYIPDADSYDLCYWSEPAMLQYTSGGYLTGYGGRLDLNVFYGNAEAWDKYAGGKPNFKPDPEPPTEGEYHLHSPYTDTYYLYNGCEQSSAVRQFQMDCGFCGYWGRNGVLVIDGYYRDECEYACECIQRFHGLPVDGYYGHDTDIALMTEIAQIQTALNKFGYNLVVDGAVGYMTISALKAFQSAHGLEPDGVCGNATRSALGI